MLNSNSIDNLQFSYFNIIFKRIKLNALSTLMINHVLFGGQ